MDEAVMNWSAQHIKTKFISKRRVTGKTEKNRKEKKKYERELCIVLQSCSSTGVHVRTEGIDGKRRALHENQQRKE
ncbi:hypothetical protein NECAME_09039 [Necator americanus]|uniref:Uncharacterized protein n=1 Tax=Necator americanus TaxID=51031 RepID=W2TGF3_NECAM|nr:hypothetical protein NECAME_09039 [Necator americanus]ETN80679.1 hypothetical protein NECAME_09039 [Necator americanus]